MGGDGLLDLDRRDVLAAGDHHVLGPVEQLDVAVRVHHAEVTGVEPSSGEGCGGGVGVLEVALHHAVAGHDHFAHRHAVGRHVDECRLPGCRALDDADGVGVDHRDPLPRLECSAIVGFQVGPSRLRGAHGEGAVGLGQPVHLGHVDPEVLESPEDGR